jgi:hypothetical protein
MLNAYIYGCGRVLQFRALLRKMVFLRSFASHFAETKVA